MEKGGAPSPPGRRRGKSTMFFLGCPCRGGDECPTQLEAEGFNKTTPPTMKWAPHLTRGRSNRRCSVNGLCRPARSMMGQRNEVSSEEGQTASHGSISTVRLACIADGPVIPHGKRGHDDPDG